MWRGFACGAVCMAVVMAACAEGSTVGFEQDDDDDDGSGAHGAGQVGGGGQGAALPTDCDQDSDCAPLTDDCNDGRCSAGKCVAMPANEQASCDDGDPCTGDGNCSSGSCQAAGPIDCSHLDDDCNVGACEAQQGCVKQPANSGDSCDDGLFCSDGDVCDAAGSCAGPDAHDCGPPSGACFTIACDDNQDACVETAITNCTSGDGCCPNNCSMPQDTDCNCGTNLALTATPLSSGGGSAPCCAVSRMNDGETQSSCNFHWITNDQTPSGDYIEYQWSSPVTVGSIYIDTQPASAPPCGNSAGRNFNSADVQYHNGSNWVTAGSFSGLQDDVAFDLPQPVSTTRLRVYNVTSSPPWGNAIIFEWYVYPSAGCTP